jgi:hypothetical protein
MSLQQFSTDLRNSALSSAAKHTSFQTFIAYFDTLKVAALGTRTFTDNQLSQHIFKNTWNINQERMIIEKHLFAAYNTLQRLNTRITETNFPQYEFLLTSLAGDLFEVVKYVEVQILQNTFNFSMGSRPDQNAREIFDVSRMMLEIGTVIPSNLYLREVFPVSIFLLRQTIEVYGKRMLGYYSITNEQNQRARGVSTQVAWAFIKKETLKPNSRITLPTDIDTIIKVEEWTNYYVHTGDIPEIHLIENAIHMIFPIIFPQNSTERNYKNTIVCAGTSKIRDYHAVKADFETFVNQSRELNLFKKFWNWLLIILRIKKRPSKRVVQWKAESSVDATIINL